MRKVERGQSKTTFEHIAHIAHLGGVEMGQVDGDQSLQPANILRILRTLEVSKQERSRVVKAEQPLNMLFISMTQEVSKWDKSRVVKPLLYPNISLMSVTQEVLRCSSPSMVVRLPKCLTTLQWRWDDGLRKRGR